MKRLILVPPLVYALILLLVSHGLAKLLPVILDLSARKAGVAFMLAGVGLVFWAFIHFRRRKTTPIPTGEPTALVLDGPYRHTRNPMYLGVLLSLTGIAFYLGNATYFLAPIGFFLVMDRLFIPYEEEKLARLFGLEYEKMQGATHRWCGFRSKAN